MKKDKKDRPSIRLDTAVGRCPVKEKGERTMKKRIRVLSIVAGVVLPLLLAACPSEYKIASPVSVTASAELTRNRDGKIVDSAGKAIPAAYSATFDIPTLAAANFVNIDKIKEIDFSYTISDDDYWLQSPALNYVIGSANPIPNDGSAVLLAAKSGASFHGSTPGTLVVPYVKAGDGKLKIGIATGGGPDVDTATEIDVDIKITGAKIVF